MRRSRPNAFAENLRALGARNPDELPRIPEELRDFVASLTPAKIREIKLDVQELERLGIRMASRYGHVSTEALREDLSLLDRLEIEPEGAQKVAQSRVLEMRASS